MYSLKMIQEAKFKLNEPNAIDGAADDKTPPFIRRRNEKLGTGAAEEPNKKTSRGKGRSKYKPNNDPEINVRARSKPNKGGAVGDTPKTPAFIRRKNEKLNAAGDTPKTPAFIRRKNEKLGLDPSEGPIRRGRFKSNNVEDHNAHVKAKEEHDDTRARAKKINDKLVADAHADEFWKKRNTWKAATAWKTDKGNTALIAAKHKAANEEAKAREAALKRIEDNKAAAKAKLKADEDAAKRKAANEKFEKAKKRIEANEALKAAVNADAHVAARKKHLENKAKTSKQRKKRGAIALGGLAATGGLAYQHRDKLKSAYDDI